MELSVVKTRIVDTNIEKMFQKLPKQVVESYKTWRELIRNFGLETIRNCRGFRDEALKGKWKGYRSSRLNKKYRVIYKIQSKDKIVYIEKVDAHKY